jgi:hypothetical protein
VREGLEIYNVVCLRISSPFLLFGQTTLSILGRVENIKVEVSQYVHLKLSAIHKFKNFLYRKF